MENIDWKNMDDETFEKKRKEVIGAFIANSRNKVKLERMQWSIDMKRRKWNNLRACIELSDMMWESFHKLNEALAPFRDLKK